MNPQAIPLSLYIHIPWCVKKCPYCDFNSHALKTELPEDTYIQALLDDLTFDLPLAAGRSIDNIFIGGGTPSLFSPTSLAKLITGIRERISINHDAEITLEANPGTVEQQKFIGFRKTGINRLSIGIQSLQNDKLKALGRIHNADEALKAATAAKQAGFDNFNLDFMFGLPQQTTADALFDLENAIKLNPNHISWYQLTLEPNTLFHHQPPTLPADDAIWDMQLAGQALLAKHGYQQYEVSAYAKADKQSQHNLNYWLFGDYLGIGAGAHSKLTNHKNITRYTKAKHPKDYLNPSKNFITSQRTLEKKELPLEFMMNALRLKQAIPSELFTTRTGLAINQISPILEAASNEDLLQLADNTFQISPHGYNHLNELLLKFMLNI